MIPNRSYSLAVFLVTLLLGAPVDAQVQKGGRALPPASASGDEAVPLERTGQGQAGGRPEGGAEAGKTGTPVAGSGQADAEPGRIKPSAGILLLDRMGVPLPDLPAEKPYSGPIDEVFGAYQRGLWVTAMDKAMPRAQLGDPAAQTLVAELINRGLGVRRDPKQAAFWYGQAASNGDAPAMFKYALLLMEGREVKRDKAKADEYMHKSAEAGDGSAQFNWAQTLVAQSPGEKGLKLALPYYEKSAEQGIADSQYAVAQIYRQLPDIGKEKRDKARYWMERAALAGFDTAQLDMGIWLVNGIGGERDLEGGFNWLKIAANRGNVVAQNRLAHLYINALGTRPNPIEAAKWYVLSRRAGLKDAALEDFYLGLTDEQQKQSIDAANKFRRS